MKVLFREVETLIQIVKIIRIPKIFRVEPESAPSRIPKTVRVEPELNPSRIKIDI